MAGLGMNLGAGLSQGYSQSANSGGSVNSAENNSYSYNSSWNDAWSDASSEAYGWTEADIARQWSALMANWAWEKNMEAFHEQMDYNKQQAQYQRQFQADMANTLYTRSVKNMKEAGINPILAYNMGLSGANVGTGATASLGGSPSAPLAQSFMDSYSASNSHSHSEQHGGSFGESWGTGTQSGSSWNSGWSNSEEGIVTALQNLGDMADTALAGMNAGNTLKEMSKNMGSPLTDWGYDVGQGIKNGVKSGLDTIGDVISNGIKSLGSGGGGHGFNKKMKR